MNRFRVGITEATTVFKEPLTTIGMIVKNRLVCIRKVLGIIENLEYPKEKIKLVFVDDYSTDGTFEILKEWKVRMEKSYYNVILIQEQTNIPQARTLCFRNMDGDFILFWDSDVIPPRDLLKEMVDILKSDQRVGIIGADYLYEIDNVLRRMLGKPLTNKAARAVYMGFTLIRREVFERVGGFNELLEVGEDIEFCLRAAEKTDYEIAWAPRPVLHLASANKIKRFGHGLARWLVINFCVQGEQYAKSFHKLPLLIRLRILFYALLPPVLASVTFLAHSLGVTWVALLFVVYLLPGLLLTVHRSNIRRGVVSFFVFNIPAGVVVSYGVIICLLRKLPKRWFVMKRALYAQLLP